MNTFIPESHRCPKCGANQLLMNRGTYFSRRERRNILDQGYVCPNYPHIDWVRMGERWIGFKDDGTLTWGEQGSDGVVGCVTGEGAPQWNSDTDSITDEL